MNLERPYAIVRQIRVADYGNRSHLRLTVNFLVAAQQQRREIHSRNRLRIIGKQNPKGVRGDKDITINKKQMLSIAFKELLSELITGPGNECKPRLFGRMDNVMLSNSPSLARKMLLEICF